MPELKNLISLAWSMYQTRRDCKTFALYIIQSRNIALVSFGIGRMCNPLSSYYHGLLSCPEGAGMRAYTWLSGVARSSLLQRKTSRTGWTIGLARRMAPKSVIHQGRPGLGWSLGSGGRMGISATSARVTMNACGVGVMYCVGPR